MGEARWKARLQFGGPCQSIGGSLCKTGEVHLRVTARAEDEKEAKKLVKPVVKERNPGSAAPCIPRKRM